MPQHAESQPDHHCIRLPVLRSPWFNIGRMVHVAVWTYIAPHQFCGRHVFSVPLLLLKPSQCARWMANLSPLLFEPGGRPCWAAILVWAAILGCHSLNSGAVEFETHHVSVANQRFSQLHIAAVIICNLSKVRLPARAQGQCRQGKVKWAFSYIFLMACGSVVCVTAASLALLSPSLIRLCFLMISHLEQWLKTGNSCK